MKIFYKQNDQWYFSLQGVKDLWNSFVTMDQWTAERLHSVAVGFMILSLVGWAAYYIAFAGNTLLAFINTVLLFIGMILERPSLKYRDISGSFIKWWYKMNVPIIAFLLLNYILIFLFE